MGGGKLVTWRGCFESLLHVLDTLPRSEGSEDEFKMQCLLSQVAEAANTEPRAVAKIQPGDNVTQREAAQDS